MKCSDAFLLALKRRKVKARYSGSTIRTYRHMYKTGKLGIDAIYKVLRLAGFEMIRESEWRTRVKKKG